MQNRDMKKNRKNKFSSPTMSPLEGESDVIFTC